MRIAILGATSHIAKGLISCWADEGRHKLLLFAREPGRVDAFLQTISPCEAEVYHIEDFGTQDCEVVVNCVGIGSPRKLKENLASIFNITARFDDLIIDYLERRPDVFYINLSSGAALGPDFLKPASELSEARYPANKLTSECYYGIAKLHAEAKHRALFHFDIVDLRVYGYFSHFIDPNDSFLLCEIAASLHSGGIFVTNHDDIVRDFCHPEDLHRLISCCLAQRPHNQVYDLYSRQPVSKFELLDFCVQRFGLQYELQESYLPLTVTGSKHSYYSLNHEAKRIGYQPVYSSLEGIEREMRLLLGVYPVK